MKEEYIKKKLARLLENDPCVHISVRATHSKILADNAEAKIVGVYSNIFRVEEESMGYKRFHAFQYADIITGAVEVKELGILPVSDEKKVQKNTSN